MRAILLAILCIIMLWPVISGLRSGNFPMGGRLGPRYTITRQKNPTHYWFVLALLTAMAMIVVWLAIDRAK